MLLSLLISEGTIEFSTFGTVAGESPDPNNGDEYSSVRTFVGDCPDRCEGV